MTDDLTLLTAEDSVVLHERAETGRDLIIRLLSWGEVANTPQGRETFSRGAFAEVDPTSVVIESQRHDGAIVGRGVSIEDAEDGAYLRAHISDTQEGNDLLTLIRDRVLSKASVVFRPTTSHRRADGVIERTKAGLARVAVLQKGAYPSAEVLAVREEPMTDQTPAVTSPQAEPAPVITAYDDSALLQRMDGLDEAIAKVAAAGAHGAKTDEGILTRYDSFGDAFLAAAEDPEVNALLARALADNITSDNDGLILPGNYIGRIVQPAAVMRKSINAFGGARPLPASGMSFEWAAFDAASTFVVDEQLTQKTEIATGTTGYDQKTAPVRTFAGGSDNALQLLERSSPSFREQLGFHYARQWALKTNTAFAAIISASATTDTLTLNGADDAVDAGLLQSKLFAQSLAVETETGMPANVVLAASDVYQRIGENTALMPPVYGTQNVPGVAQASTLNVAVSGLTIVHEPVLAAGTMITANSIAAGWYEDGPRTIEALNVAKLGRDIAIYSFGNGAMFHEPAVIVTTVTLI